MKQQHSFPCHFFLPSYVLLAVFTIFFLLACTPKKPNTPQTVAQAFWTATLKGDTETAKQFLTPQSRSNFKVILYSQKDFVELSEQSVTTTKAEILTQITQHKGEQKNETALRTILLNQKGQWLVDFDKTRDSMLGSELQSAFEQLSKTMRDAIDKGVKVMGESVKDELQQMQHSLQDSLQELDQEIEKQQQQQQNSQQPQSKIL